MLRRPGNELFVLTLSSVLQNPSKYKIRPGADKKGLDKKPKNRLPSPVLTKNLYMKNMINDSPMSGGSDSPCQDKAVEQGGLARAFTFDVEEGALGWNLLENNIRQDPIPPEPVALNEARLLCREAMTL